MKEDFVKEIEIIEILPCITEPGRIRLEAQVIAEGGEPLADLIPSLFLKYPPSVAKYEERDNTLTLRMYNRAIAIFPDGTIGMQNTKDENEARQILEEIRGVLNEAYLDVEKGKPSRDAIRRRMDMSRLSSFQIMRCLPNITHCHKCGEKSCTAFAFKLLRGEEKLQSCVMLRDKKYDSKREKLEKMLGGNEE